MLRSPYDADTDPGTRKPRTYTRRSEDVELREILKSQTARRIMSAGLTAAIAIGSFFGGRLKERDSENGALQRELNTARWQAYSDDWRERLVRDEAKLKWLEDDNAEMKAEIKELTLATKANTGALEKLIRELKR